MKAGTVVQLARARKEGTLWIPVRNSLHVIAEAEGKGIAKVSLHMLGEHIELLDKYSAIENALQDLQREQSEARGERVYERKVKWSRKEMAETFIRAQCQDLEERLAEQIKALGPLPEPSDKKGVAEYANRLLHWRPKKRG